MSSETSAAGSRLIPPGLRPLLEPLRRAAGGELDPDGLRHLTSLARQAVVVTREQSGLPASLLAPVADRCAALAGIPPSHVAARDRAIESVREAFRAVLDHVRREGEYVTPSQLSVDPPSDPSSGRGRKVSAESSLAPASVEGGELSRPVTHLRGVGHMVADKLAARGLRTFGDLLLYLPRTYEDRRSLTPIDALQEGRPALLRGDIADLHVRPGPRPMWRVRLADETGSIELAWFQRAPWMWGRLRVGMTLWVSGEPRAGRTGTLAIWHPDVEAGGEMNDPANVGRIVPVYTAVEGLSARTLRRHMLHVVDACASSVPEYLPPSLRAAFDLIGLGDALAQIHFPPPDAEPERLQRFSTPAQRRLVFDELFFVQFGMLLKKRGLAMEQGHALPASPPVLQAALARLPFTLTGAQRRSLDDICADLSRPTPMHRLLQGDVGSGKTAVALVAALVAIAHGYQAAIMAPTEILAEQHARQFEKWVGYASPRERGPPVHVAYVAAGRKAKDLQRARAEVESGTARLIVGTHALLSDGTRFQKLGLIVVDEQHRFGVLQRARLMQKGVHPHVLVMTATPIPRTLALTLYGDLDVSIIDERPPGRTPVATRVFTGRQRGKAYELVRRQVREGHQAYVVVPLVEESDKLELRAAVQERDRLASEELTGMKVGLVHGRMSADERHAAMEAFRSGEVQVLVATTVIEVGVDVPNATVMVIEHAERFGLSQLHQLRGRVGRGSAQSHCLLIASDGGRSASERLRVMEETADGFRLAEADLEIRGPGEFIGTRQSGLPDLVVADLLRDQHILREARAAAQGLLEHDPDLALPEHRALAGELERRWAGRISLARVG